MFEPNSPIYYVLVFHGGADANCPTTKKPDHVSELHYGDHCPLYWVIYHGGWEQWSLHGHYLPRTRWQSIWLPSAFLYASTISDVLNITRLCDDEIARFVFESDQAVERHCYIIFGDGGDKRPYAGCWWLYGILSNRNSRGFSKSAVYSKTCPCREVLNKFTKNLEDISLSPLLWSTSCGPWKWLNLCPTSFMIIQL